MSKGITTAIDGFMIKYRKYGELFVAVVLFLFFAGMRIFIGSFMDLTVERWRFVSPAVWPGWILLIGTVLSAFLIYNAYVGLRKENGEETEEEALSAEDAYEREMSLRAKYQKEGKILSVRELEALAEEQIKATAEKATSKELLRLFTIVVVTFIYLYLIRIMGFITSTLLFSFVYLLLLKEKRPLVLAIAPIALVAVIWFVFTRLLVVPLPRGTGFFMLISNLFY
ncbi:MAG: tripartite tricarboxylate transporter TctB family protein [Firmicutes bacterium]|nr:tripartite tricarboxylate transporter TctB family protein [Bacillota bacterium]